MKIAIDIDSTLCPYWDSFATAARRRFGVELPYDHQITWGIPELRPEQVRVIVAETHSEKNILAGVPYPGAVETVCVWHEAGHDIHITSHRDTGCRGATASWLEAIGLPYHELHCSYDKVAHCEEIGVDVLIDDSPVNLDRALGAGLTVATIAHPWNRELCEDEAIVCAADWPALREGLAPVLGTIDPQVESSR